MNYYEIVIQKGSNGKYSKITLYYPTAKGLSNAKRHATTMADRLGRWIWIALYYVNEQADVREQVAERFRKSKTPLLKGGNWIE
jgi:hypothetical protein